MKTFEEFSQVNESSLIDRICDSYPAHIRSLRDLLALIEKEHRIHPTLSKDILAQIIHTKL